LRGERTKETKITYQFPEDAIQCGGGDYIVNVQEQCWKVFLVEQVVFVARLIPLRFEDSIELIEEKDTIRSRETPERHEIHLLLTSFADEFQSSEEAVEAIKCGRLVQAMRGLCRSINCFPRTNSQVYATGRSSPVIDS
jgi:hypothetical protein